MEQQRISMDLHTHLNEYKVKPKHFWEAVLARELGAVAITEHIDCKPKNAFERLEALRPEGIVLIPGMELSTSAGHVLAYGKSAELFEITELQKNNLHIKRAIELAKANDIMLSFSHPWGFSHDSAYYKIGMKKLTKIIKTQNVGVEVFNGMIWQLGEFVYSSDWIRKPINFFDFLERNVVSRKIKLSVLGARAKKQLSTKAWEVVTRNAYAIELGKHAGFVTAGSDAHSADRIGSGMLRMKVEEDWQEPARLLEMIKEKERIVWSGPFMVETAPGRFEKISDPLRNGEIIKGVRYAAAKKIGPRSLGRKIVETVKENL